MVLYHVTIHQEVTKRAEVEAKAGRKAEFIYCHAGGKNKILAMYLLPNTTRHIFIIPSGGAAPHNCFCYTVSMPGEPRIVTISHDGCIQLTPLDLQELGLTPVKNT